MNHALGRRCRRPLFTKEIVSIILSDRHLSQTHEWIRALARDIYFSGDPTMLAVAIGHLADVARIEARAVRRVDAIVRAREGNASQPEKAGAA